MATSASVALSPAGSFLIRFLEVLVSISSLSNSLTGDCSLKQGKYRTCELQGNNDTV